MQCIFVDFCSKLCIFVNSKCIILTVTAITAFTVILVEYYSAIVAALINIWHAYASVTYLFVLTKKTISGEICQKQLGCHRVNSIQRRQISKVKLFYVHVSYFLPSVLWCCRLGGRKGILLVRTEWWGAGIVICLEWGADMHMAQLMPLPLNVSCFSKIQIGFTLKSAKTASIPNSLMCWDNLATAKSCITGRREQEYARQDTLCCTCCESWPGDLVSYHDDDM